MQDARAVANFFLDRARETGSALTIMTLLKVLYFAHAWHLAKTDRPLIAQPFEAWKHGPVNRVVYDQYKHLGKNVITEKAVSFNPRTMKYTATPYSFDDDTQELLSNIFDYYSKFHPFKLSDLTHEPGAPWHSVWVEAETRAVPGMIIPNERIAAWFKDRRALYWTDREQRTAT